MRKILHTLLITSLLFGCSKKEQTVAHAEPVLMSPDEAKIEITLSKMSERARKEIRINDKKQFLNDLIYVLSEENKYTGTSLPLFFLIDKKHYADESYIPENLTSLKPNSSYKLNKEGLMLRSDMTEPLMELANAAKKDGFTLTVSSTYRSYEYQKNLFNYWVKVDGLEEAERESARPGTSQHQLGSAIDFGNIDDSFIDTPEGQWMYDNASKYGWSLSFPKNYEDVTGYRWECWHYRYIGKTACAFQEKYFNNIQQFMLEFIDLWKNAE